MAPRRMRTAPSLPRQLLDELHGTQTSNSRRNGNLALKRREARKEFRIDKKRLQMRNSSTRSTVGKSASLGRSVREPDNGNLALRARGNRVTKLTENLESETERGSEDETLEPAPSSENEPFTVEISAPRPDRATQRQLDEDDARIAALERRLGRRGKNAGMENLLGEIGALGGISDSENEIEFVQAKRKHDSDDENWLQSKRRRAVKVDKPIKQLSEDDSDVFEGFNDSGVDESEDGDEGREDGETETKQRENPYVPPSSVKYVPPSRRASLPNDIEGRQNQQLQQQLRGILNKLSESNMLDIIRATDHIFTEHSRNAASTNLIGLMMLSLADRTALNDTFIILHAGFIAGLYRMLGVDFGARCVQAVIERIDAAHNPESGKVQLNLISLLSELYNFHVIGSRLIYDFIKLYILDLSEHSAELLLKVVRTSGSQLRQDNPSSLNDVVALLQDSVKRLGEPNLSVRTKFMIDTINDLKNNRVRTGIQASSIRAEHAVRVKKILGSINSSKAFSSKAVEPLRIGLSDIRDSESRGKWWLVGASYRDDTQLRRQDPSMNRPYGHDTNEVCSQFKHPETRTGEEASVTTDAEVIARSLGMNTDIRRVLFISIMTAASVDEAFARVIKLSLTKRQRPEVATVLSRCTAAEKTYNPFYAVLAKRLSGQREVRKSLWNPLIECLARLKDQDEGGSDDEGAPDEWWSSPQAKFNLAQFYGSLIAEQVIGLNILKARSLLQVGDAESSFLELLFVKLFLVIRSDKRTLQEIMAAVMSDEDVGFAKSLKIFIESVVRRTDLAHAKDVAVVKRCSTASLDILDDLLTLR